MRIEHIGDATLYLGDCLEAMRDMPDKAFDIAIVDPPYGDGGGGQWDGKRRGRFGGGRFKKYSIGESITHTADTSSVMPPPPKVSRTGGTWSMKYQTEGGRPSDIRHWDFAPPEEYFEQLFRISKHQVIWGGNYFALPPSRNFLIWRKLTISEAFSMAMAEYAWTDFPGNAKVFEYAPQDSERFHPTQKPVALYRWVLSLFAMNGDKILDTHMGSGSLVVACAELGYEISAMEINEDYFSKACKRIREAYRQPRLFEDEKPKYKQAEMGI